MPRLVLALLCCLFPIDALAQVYLGGAVGADTMLVTSVQGNLAAPDDRGGTVPLVAARVGVALGPRWGIEFEAAQSLTLERSQDIGQGLAARTNVGSVTSFTNFTSFGSGVSSLPTRILQAPTITVESERRATSFNALGWFRYPVNARLDFAFVAGAAFVRTWSEQRITFDLPGFPTDVVTSLFSAEPTEIVNYDVGPLVGTEAWIAFGDRFHVVPGVRLSGISGGWSVRPTVGAAWTF